MTTAPPVKDAADRAMTVHLVIGFSPGSASDDMAKLLGPALAHELNRPVVVKRMLGEDGACAARYVAQNPAGSDTLLIATLGTHALKPHFEPRPGYDPLGDFTPVVRLAQAPLVLATGATSSYRTLGDAVIACRTRPGELTFGASAIGGAPFLAAELFRQRAGLDIRHTIYDQTIELYADLAAGRIAFSFNNLMSMLPRIRRGELRALAVTSAERVPVLPEVPSVTECGMGGCVISNWLGIVGGKTLRADTVSDLNAACCRALASPAMREPLAQAGLTAVPGSPTDFGRFIGEELAHWAPIAQAAQDDACPVATLSQS